MSFWVCVYLKLCIKRALKLDPIFKVPKVPKKVISEMKIPVAPTEKVDLPAAKGIGTLD